MGYKVTDTREISRMTQAGSEIRCYRVWLVTGNGATGTVDIAAEDWIAETLQPILDAKAEELDLAFSLAS